MKQSIFMLLLCATLAVSAQQQGEVIRLWPNGAPNSNDLPQQEQVDPSGRVSNVSDPVIIVFRPAKPNGITIIGCPGGGYSRLAMTHEGYDFAPWLNVMGYTYVVLKYRMPNGHSEVPLSDAEQAMRIVRQRAEDWHIKADKVGIMGFSAGGHLASTLATHYSSPETRPDFQILFYPVITMLEGTHGGSKLNLLGPNPSEELTRKFSNELQVNQQTPPAFIALSDDDKGVPPVNSIGYYTALNRHGVSASLHIYPSGGHGWGFRDSFAYKRQWTGELEQWLRRNIEP